MSNPPETCTCGAILVENARFCHRCGRPTFETVADIPAPELSRLAMASLASPSRAPAPVGFRNPVALRVAFLMSVGIMLMQMIPGVQLFLPVWWLAAGWGAVALYRRLTGFTLNVRAGARLGSLTGVLTFLSMTVVISVTLLVAGKESFQQMVKQNPQLSTVFNDRAQLAGVLLMVLCLIFAMVVGICAAGGALGARFAGPRANSSSAA